MFLVAEGMLFLVVVEPMVYQVASFIPNGGSDDISGDGSDAVREADMMICLVTRGRN